MINKKFVNFNQLESNALIAYREINTTITNKNSFEKQTQFDLFQRVSVASEMFRTTLIE